LPDPVGVLIFSGKGAHDETWTNSMKSALWRYAMLA
jgi:hypothetical protein